MRTRDRGDVHHFNESLGRVMRGLLIFALYEEVSGSFIEGGRDIVFITTPPGQIPLTDEDLKALEDLGWIISEEYDLWIHFT